MNDLQKRELEILKSFIKVCDLLEIKYFMVCGSALGAVKYSGFIPWDDDIDVALTRKDYDLFCLKAPKLLRPGLLLQNYQTEKYFPILGSKIRDVNTTYIERETSEIDMCHGVFIDVFPLDGYPTEGIEEKKFFNKRLSVTRKMIVRNTYNRLKYVTSVRTLSVYALHRLFGFYSNTSKYIGEMNDVFRRFPLEESRLWCNYANSSSSKEFAPREQYGDGTCITFEGIKVRVPEQYDEYLSQKYGDWRADLPVEQQVGHHYAAVVDLHHPYTDYIVRLGKGRIRLKTPDELLRDGITPTADYQY